MKFLAFILLIITLSSITQPLYSWNQDAAGFYPLSVRNKWVYAYYYTQFGNTYFGGFRTTQIVSDSLNPAAKIKFQIPLSRGVNVPSTGDGRGMFAKLIVFDAIGSEVEVLVNQQMQPGTYEVSWDATAYPSGVYFYKLESGNFTETKKMVLIK
jgi:hypothetical protein